jgi:hypothetical protein
MNKYYKCIKHIIYIKYFIKKILAPTIAKHLCNSLNSYDFYCLMHKF